MAVCRCSTVWRWVVVAGVLTLGISPVLPLLAAALGQRLGRPLWTPSFAGAVLDSLALAVGVAIVSLLLGLPLGLFSALYRFPGRLPLVVAQALPLLLPSFLPAIGWSNLVATGWLPWFLSPAGFHGSVFVLGVQAVPLPFFATSAACHNLTASQIDAARLHDGEMTVLRLSARACAPVAVLSALLAGILSLSDPGAPLILGCRSVAVEIRTSFSAFHDYDLAGRQCLAVAGLVLLLTAPVLIIGLRWLAAAMLARQTRPAAPYPHRTLSRIALMGLIAAMIVGIGLPTFGLCLPAINNPMLGRAAQKAWTTTGPSLAYSGGAGVIAVLLAISLALATARDLWLRLVALGVLLVMLALPPALGALGASHAVTKAPPQLDWLTRSQFAVILVLGLRFLPVATVAMMRAVGSLSPSWADAARLHGVSPSRLFFRVILPVLTRPILIGLLLVMVLAAADITTTHLLQPPGRPSLPVAIFTVMANAPEGLVASLCLLYLLSVVLLMVVASQLPRWCSRRIW